MDWPRILAYITGTVDKELLVRNEYLVAENRILKNQIKGRLLLSDPEKRHLPKSATGSAARRLKMWLTPPGRTRFWDGSESSWPRSSTAPRRAETPAGRN